MMDASRDDALAYMTFPREHSHDRSQGRFHAKPASGIHRA